MAFGAHIQTTAGANASSGTNISDTMTAAVSGNLLLMYVQTGDAVLNAPSGWSTAVAGVNGSENDAWGLFYKISTGGETTITATSGSSDEWACFLSEFEGPWEASPVDLSEAEARTAAANDYTTAPAGTTSQASELAVSCIYYRGTGALGTETWSDGFTARHGESSSAKSVFGATKLLSATGSVTTTLTYPQTSKIGMGGLATFKEASGGASYAITGSVTYSVAIGATMEHQNHFALTGSVPYGTAIGATMAYTAIRQISGTVANSTHLVDVDGNALASETNIGYEWYDSTSNTNGNPADTGTFSTDGSGEWSITLTTTLDNGQSGTLLLKKGTGATAIKAHIEKVVGA